MADFDLQNSVSTNFTTTVHKAPYPAISPTNPLLSQSGKTVLITGGGAGIGKAIARHFVLAGASTVIIIGRRVQVLEETAAELKGTGSSNILTRGVDVTDDAGVTALWDSLATDGIHVDVLILNSGVAGAKASILELGLPAVWDVFETNVKGPLHFAERFYKQSSKPKSLVSVSSAVIHYRAHPIVAVRPTYALTKSAGTLAMTLIADDVSADKMQVVNFHPGMIYTSELEREGIPEHGVFEFDDPNLPGAFAVWAASPEAKYLHGRYVYAAWDVEELKEQVSERLSVDRDYLALGVKGLKWGKKDLREADSGTCGPS